jgi:hypothetical protein
MGEGISVGLEGNNQLNHAHVRWRGDDAKKKNRLGRPRKLIVLIYKVCSY